MCVFLVNLSSRLQNVRKFWILQVQRREEAVGDYIEHVLVLLFGDYFVELLAYRFEFNFHLFEARDEALEDG